MRPRPDLRSFGRQGDREWTRLAQTCNANGGLVLVVATAGSRSRRSVVRRHAVAVPHATRDSALTRARAAACASGHAPGRAVGAVRRAAVRAGRARRILSQISEACLADGGARIAGTDAALLAAHFIGRALARRGAAAAVAALCRRHADSVGSVGGLHVEAPLVSHARTIPPARARRQTPVRGRDAVGPIGAREAAAAHGACLSTAARPGVRSAGMRCIGVVAAPGAPPEEGIPGEQSRGAPEGSHARSQGSTTGRMAAIASPGDSIRHPIFSAMAMRSRKVSGGRLASSV